MALRNVLVVGAGPVGLSAAYFLSKVAGLNVSIVEKHSHRDQTILSKALNVNIRTMEIFDKTPIQQSLLQQAYKVNYLELYSKSNLIMKANIHKILLGNNKFTNFFIVPQGQTQRIIEDELKKVNINVKYGSEVISVKNINNGVIVAIKSQNQVKQQKYDIVLAADGAHSLIRKNLGLKMEGETLETKLYLCDAILKDHQLHSLKVTIDGNVTFLMIPITGQTVRLIGNCSNYMDYLPKKYICEKTTWHSEFTINNRVINKMREGNVYFAGDASHVHAPIGGRGMNLGIQDVFVFAKLLEKNQLQNYDSLRRQKAKNFVNKIKRMSAIALSQKHPYLRKLFPYFVKYCGSIISKNMVFFASGLEEPFQQLAKL